MKHALLQWTAAGGLALTALGPSAHAQSADALIDKLVEKGILTDSEARDLREEADKGFTTAHQVKTGMPDWVTAFKINGDFRGRIEGFYADPDDPGVEFVDRTRLRYRLRLGFVAVLQDNFEIGLRLGSGDIDNAGGLANGIDPISTNQSFQNNASKKGIFIDMAYARWAFLNTPHWSAVATFGKMENPFLFSDAVFDGDYTPEGLGAQFKYTLNDQHALKASLGGFILDEIGADADDPFFTGIQLRWDATYSPQVSSTMGIAALGIANAENLSNTAVPNINRGNTRTTTGTLVYNYNPIVADASATYTLAELPSWTRWLALGLPYSGAFPIKVGGDVIHNPAAPDHNTGFSLGATFGKAGKRRTWESGYTYKYLEGDAWYEEMVDSDFGAFYQAAPPGGSTGYQSGTNAEGHILRFAYSPYDSLTLSAKWFLTQLIEPSPANSDSTMNRLQLDLQWKF